MSSEWKADTKATSKRLYSNSAEQVEAMVIDCVPNWRVYPRPLRVLLASLPRFGSFKECLQSFADWDEFVGLDETCDPVYRDEVKAIASEWYDKGRLPKRGKRELTFTLLNQQLFYESTMAANAKMYLTVGNQNASDVKMAVEGGFGNALEIERIRHNAVRKADAERKAGKILSDVMTDREEEGGIFDGERIEYVPPIAASEEIDDD